MNGERGSALVALSGACFVSVTSEYLPITVLPQLASDFEVPAGLVGTLVSGYAFAVAVLVIPLVTATNRLDRRTTAVSTLALIVLSNLILAVAPTFTIAAGARIIAALGHGVFWSIVVPLATRVSGDRSAGRTTAIVFAGNAVASVVGLPASSAIAAAFGWRATALVLAIAAAACAAAIAT